MLPLLPLVVWRLSLARDVREALAAREAAGLPVSLADLDARLPNVAPEDNRAKIYYEAGEALQETPNATFALIPFFGGTPLPEPTEPLATEVVEALNRVVESNKAPLAKLHRAADLPGTSYLVQYSARASEDALSYLPGFAPLVTLLCQEALVALEEGDSVRALDSLRTAIVLTGSVEHLGFENATGHQWELERFIIETLERVLHGPTAPDAVLAPFVEHFSPEHREAVYRRVIETEQALFIARIREGRKRSLLKGLVLAAGVGDLNIRSYLAAVEPLLAWPEANFDRRNALERVYADKERSWEESPLLFATALRFAPPAPTGWIKDELDRAAVTSVALAATRFRWATGSAPEALADLAPGYLDAVPESATTGAPVAFVREAGAVYASAAGVRLHIPR